MKITVIGRKCTPRDSFKERAEKRLKKVEKFFGSVIPPRTEEYAYYENITCTKKECEEALYILEALGDVKRIKAYRNALEHVSKLCD